MPRSPRGLTTSLESISIQPRTPKTPRSNAGPTWRASDEIGQDEVELSLLGEDEQRQAAQGMTLEEEQEYLAQAEKKPTSAKDKRALALLIILCECSSLSGLTIRSRRPDLIQGFPVRAHSFDHIMKLTERGYTSLGLH